ncbi:L7Ae/L30e/S12e/Gadd45 family ribosomal protein [Pectinatus sottacetonis]|uniref:L7Ae/L30e/S12e/Gadd45 family ribosomal protein n=1 Tax=Pectinatus sottacetonis TaxID=1002795 RepID=UPI0018C8585D|nr:ribosomal L7Ae/L30e/S12e/Gadd45 family protein [Pectinatus sottacetonis]
MNNIQQKLFNILSMASCANKIISGDFAINKIVDKKNIKLLLIAENTAEKTCQEYKKLNLKYNVPVKKIPLGKDELGRCAGKTERAALAVCDEGFAKTINKILK